MSALPPERPWHGFSETDAFEAVTEARCARFWAKVERSGECWLWLGAKTQSRYGCFTIAANGKYRTVQAHRLSYWLLRGSIPPGLDLDHLCRERQCVNPEHLDPVTRKENVHRSPTHNAGKTACHRGHTYTAETTALECGRWRRCLLCRAETARRQRKVTLP